MVLTKSRTTWHVNDCRRHTEWIDSGMNTLLFRETENMQCLFLDWQFSCQQRCLGRETSIFVNSIIILIFFF